MTRRRFGWSNRKGYVAVPERHVFERWARARGLHVEYVSSHTRSTACVGVLGYRLDPEHVFSVKLHEGLNEGFVACVVDANDHTFVRAKCLGTRREAWTLAAALGEACGAFAKRVVAQSREAAQNEILEREKAAIAVCGRLP